MCARYTQKTEQDIRYPGTGVMNSCMLPRGCWEPSPDPLQEQQVLFPAELATSLAPSLHFIY